MQIAEHALHDKDANEVIGNYFIKTLEKMEKTFASP